MMSSYVLLGDIYNLQTNTEKRETSRHAVDVDGGSELETLTLRRNGQPPPPPPPRVRGVLGGGGGGKKT